MKKTSVNNAENRKQMLYLLLLLSEYILYTACKRLLGWGGAVLYFYVQKRRGDRMRNGSFPYQKTVNKEGLIGE